MTFLWVSAALIAFTLGVWGLVERIKNARKPAENAAEWRRSVEERLKADKLRLDSLDNGQKAVCRGMLALLDGSEEEKDKARKGITEYLIER